MSPDRRAAALWALLSLIVLGVAYWALVPAGASAELTDSAPEPTAGLSSADMDRIDLYGSWIGPLELVATIAPVLTVLLLGLTPLGSGLARRIGPRLRVPALRGLFVVAAVVAIAWLVRLPVQVARELLRNQAGSISGGWPAWALREATTLVGWWALASLVVLAVSVTARRLRHTWWLVLSLSAGLLVGAASWIYGQVSVSESSWPSLSDADLRSDVFELSTVLGVEVSDVQVVPETPTTTIYNAYVTGVGEQHLVVIYETMLKRSTDDEVRAVVAHELGHVAADDAVRRAALAGLAVTAGVALVGVAAPGTWLRRRVGIRADDDLATLEAVPLLVALGLAAMVVLLPVLNAASRAIEVRADLAALRATDDPEALAGVVRRAAVLNLEQPYPSWLIRSAAGHPAPAERVQLAQEWAER